MDSTRYLEDRLPRPGPRRRPGIDLKYLYYGFAYLQVSKWTGELIELNLCTTLQIHTVEGLRLGLRSLRKLMLILDFG